MSLVKLAQQEQLQRQFTAQEMEEVVNRLDMLHDYASLGQLPEVTPLSSAELRGWLEELIFVARETLREMEEHPCTP